MKNFYFWMLTLLCSTIAFGQLSENFESDITTRGWSLYQTDSSDPGFVLTTAESQSGNASYYHNDEFVDNESTAYMVSPAYTVQSGDEFSAYVRQNYSVSYYNYSGIAISNASGDPIANPADFVEVWEAGAGFAEDSWEQVVLALDAYVGQSIYVAFVYTGDFDHEYYVDNMYIGTPCTAPVASISTTGACDTGSFNVNIDLSSLGTASSVIVSDDQGNSQTANATGALEFGPYTSGTDVTFTLADADNSSCNTALATTYLCPPDNDDCANATLISSFPHTSSEDATGATQEDFVYCGPDGSNDGVWYLIEGESAQFTINVTSTGWDAAITLLSGACGELTCIDFEDNVASNNTETISFIGQVGVNYYLNVGAYSANADLPEGAFELEITSDDIPCGSPANLAVAATTDLSTDVTWQGAADNASYDLVWGATGFTPGASANASGLGDSPYTITGLTPETTYDLYVRGNCNPGFSEWVGPVTFTTLEEGAILAGTDCIHPIYVDTLPYTTTDNTSNYGDDYDGGQGTNCGSSSQYYLNGDDVVYAYTPAEDSSIDISMTPTATWSGLFVYEDCNDIGVACIAGVSNTNSSARVIEDLLVTAGQTYFIVISTWASPQSTGYDLVITENTCIAGNYEATAVGACDTQEYFVEIDITDMGDLSSYVISDDQESESQTVTETGVYTFGPYAEGSTVSFNLEANDANCNDSFTIQYFCPALNDDCENAIDVPVNPDFLCAEVVTGSTLGATASPQEDDVVGTPNNDVWFSFVAESTAHRVSLSNIINLDGGTTTDMAMGVYDATGGCDALVLVGDSDPNTLDLFDLSIGTEYLIRVYNWSSTISSHSFDICVGTPPPAPANDDCSGALAIACGETINGDTTSSTPSGLPTSCNGYSSSDARDLFYTFEADGTSDYLVSLNSLSGFDFDGVLFVYSGECGSLVSLGCSDSGNPEQVELLAPAAGTYYIRVFDYSGTEAFSLELECTENTCAPGDFNLVTQGACETEEFNVDINFNHLGTLESYIVTDDQGSDAQTVTEAGTISFGPYASETVVNFTFEANDPNCSDTQQITFRCAAEGDICESAIVVGELPYSTTDNTGNYVDDYNGSPGANCGSTSSYLGGDDVVYAYTATSDTSIDISLTPGGGWSGIFVYENCQDIGVECVAGVANSGSNERLIDDFIVTAGQTYYIVISSWPSPQSIDYTLLITENTCVPGEFTVTATGACDTMEFFVEVDITDMGSLASYEITDNQGSAAQTATEPGTFTFGPYASLTDVTIDLTADDSNCSGTASVTYRCPGPGDTCENPLIVDSLPYVTDDNTANYEDDYDGSPGAIGCTTTASYLGGDDVVYAYTATSDTSIKINMSTSATWTGMFVYESCEDIGVECATGLRNTGSGGVIIEDFDVVAGQTYYIILSSFPSPQSYEYNLTITENSCDPIEYSISTTDQCETGEFMVTIDVTSLGTSETLSVSDNQESEAQTLTDAGSLTFGPYPESEIIEFEFTTDDPNCFETASTSFTCPAANDDCMDATELTVGSSFTDNSILANNMGATTSETMPAPGCAYYQGGEVWFSVVIPASGNVVLETRNSNLDAFNDTGMAAYSGSCDALTLIACNDDGGENNGFFSQLNLTGQTPGETIYVAVWEYGNNLEGTFLVGAYDSTMGVADFASRDAVKLYPNPTSSELNVSGIELNQVQVYSASGKLVPVKVTGNIVDTRNLPSGAYFIRMTDAEGKAILKKFIKK